MKHFLKLFADEFTRDLIEKWFAFLEDQEGDNLDRLAAQSGLLNRWAVWIQRRLLLSGLLALFLSILAPLCIMAFMHGPWRPWLILLYTLYPLPVVFCWSHLAGRGVRLNNQFTPGERFTDGLVGRLSRLERARFKAALRDAEDHYRGVQWLAAPLYALMAGYLTTQYEVWTTAVLFFEHEFRLLWQQHQTDLRGTAVLIILSGFYFLTLVLPVSWLSRRKLDLESWQDLHDAKN